MHVEQGLTRLLHALGSMLLTGSHVEIEGRAVKHCYILRMLVSIRLEFLHVDAALGSKSYGVEHWRCVYPFDRGIPRWNSIRKSMTRGTIGTYEWICSIIGNVQVMIFLMYTNLQQALLLPSLRSACMEATTWQLSASCHIATSPSRSTRVSL